MLTDRESNVLADDEEGNTIVETVDSSGAVLDSCGNIIAAGDVERNVGLNDGEGNVVAIDEKGNTIVEAADGSGAVLGFDGNIIAAGDAEGNMVLTDGEGSAVVGLLNTTTGGISVSKVGSLGVRRRRGTTKCMLGWFRMILVLTTTRLSAQLIQRIGQRRVFMFSVIQKRLKQS